MSSDGSSCSVVGDSETDDEEQGFFYPHSRVESSPATPLEKSQSVQGSIPEVPVSQYAERVVESRIRNFRQRKAIQRLPYSLDRIKHRQLLQGIDVSSFEAASEGITVPQRSAPLTEGRARQQVPENRDEIPYTGEKSDLDSDSGPLLRPRAAGSLPRDAEQDGLTDNDFSSEEDESDEATKSRQIMFRGRKVDIERGYRGILPRIAWEKALKRNESASKAKKRLVPDDRKGLAKRKVVDVRRSNQDEDLLNDLVVPDEDLGERQPETSNDQAVLQEKYLQELTELERMSAYYQNKYEDDSSSDGSPEEYDPPGTPFKEQSGSISGIQTLNDSLSVVSDPEKIAQWDSIDSSSHSDDQGIAIETDGGIIEAMLMKQRREGTVKRARVTGRPPRTIQRGHSGKSMRQRRLKIVRPARKSIRKATAAKQDGVTKRANNVGGDRSPLKDTREDTKEREKKPPPKKAKNGHFGIFPERDAERNRAVNTFTTIIEGISPDFALSALQNQDSERIDLAACLQTDEASHRRLYFRAIDSLLLGKAVEPPNVVKFWISDRQYTLSRFEGGSICQCLTDVFEHIIITGITNSELIDLSESLTAFLLHLNNRSVYGPIKDFHRRFRSKVNSYRLNAKPIHFFQIAVCQFMLLEVSRYANLPIGFKIEIESEIIDHVVSFFKLLSVCYKTISKLDLDYFYQACDIIAIVMKILGGCATLWQRLEKEKLPCCVAKILVDIFPTTESHWTLLEIDNDYGSVVQALSFVHYCTQKCRWKISNEVILLFDRVFKRRRFENFPAEIDLSDSVKVIYSRTQVPECQTVFNNYLRLLQSFEVKNALVERIVPMSEIALSDSVSVLVNRLNLLIVLAERSDLNSEKRFEELVKPVIQENYLASRDTGSLKRIAESVLNGVLCLLEINCHKKSTFRANTLVLIYKSMIQKHEEVRGIWGQFLERLVSRCESSARYQSVFLRTMYPCFPLMCHQRNQAKESLLLLKLYLQKLEALGATWVQANLFQTVQIVVHESGGWIEYYCAIGKFLIDHNVMTWWSFFVYNNVENNCSVRLSFSYQIAQLCDPQSFDLIKRSLFEIAAENFFSEESALFAKFVAKLINREDTNKTSFKARVIAHSPLNLLERFVFILSKLSYCDLILRLVSDIKVLYHDKKIDTGLATRLTNLFNSQFVDQVKDSYDFSLMKRDLGISDEEADKSSFRDSFRKLDSAYSQACYLERGMVRATVTAEEVTNFLDKVKSLFTFSVLPDPFHFMVSLIDAHLRGDSGNFRVKAKIVMLYMRLINEVLLARYGQVSADEFLQQCRLFKIICERLPLLEFASTQDGLLCAYESVRFQIITLRISQGFLEQDLLAAYSNVFLRAVDSPVIAKHTELSEQIDEIVKESAGQILQLESYEPIPDCETLRSLIEVKEQRGYSENTRSNQVAPLDTLRL